MHGLPLSRVAAFYVAMLSVGLALMAAAGDLGRLAPNEGAAAWAEHVGGGAAVGLLVVFLSRFSSTRFAWGRRLADEFRPFFSDLSAPRSLVIAILSGVSEEVLFRGVLQPALGLWLTTAIFGLLHIGPSKQFAAWTIMALLAGLLLGGLSDLSGALVAPIVAHVLINFMNLRALARRDEALV